MNKNIKCFLFFYNWEYYIADCVGFSASSCLKINLKQEYRKCIHCGKTQRKSLLPKEREFWQSCKI